MNNSPTTAITTIPPNTTVSDDVVCDCPIQQGVTIIQIGLNSAEDSGKFIHNEFKWNDTLVTSPVSSNMMTFGADSQVAYPYVVKQGIQSTGVCTYSGSDVGLRSNEITMYDYNWAVTKDNSD